MLPFSVVLVPGESPARQIVFAATKAVLSGELPAGRAFPSVRELSTALKINPNTAHKAITELVRTGILTVVPAVGSVVAGSVRTSAWERRTLLITDVDQLVVEAKRLGLSQDDVIDAISARWSKLFGADAEAAAPRGRSVRRIQGK